MIQNAVAYIFSPSVSISAEGLKINTFAYSDALNVNFQPANLTEAQLQAYGLSTEASNAKKMFIDACAILFLLNRVFCKGDWYEVRALNTWSTHKEAILAPVLSTINFTFTSSNITTAPTAGAIYTVNAKRFTVIATALTLAAGKYSGTFACTGTGLPTVYGTLTRLSGVGDDTINFSEYRV